MAPERDDAADPLRWHRTTLDGRVVHYAEVGEGPPVVFLHGWGLTSRSYVDALPAIAKAGGRVIAPALPGFGSSEALPGELTWTAFARWVDQLLDHLDVEEPAFLIGHSFGGGVATMTAWHYPQRARSLVLVNAVGGAVWKHGQHGASSLEDRPWWDWGLHLPRDLYRREYRRVVPVIARDFLGNLLANPRNLLRAGRLARTADLREELADLGRRGIPVTILWGDRDTLVPESAFVAMCDAAGAEGDVIARGGHSWLLADPEGFAEVITNSLTVHALLAQRGSGEPLAGTS